MKDSRELRLYPNRRIYDPLRSRYIKYEDVFQLVRRGTPIRVSTTGIPCRECTQKILLDVFIREEIRCGDDARLLTTAFLLDFIRVAHGMNGTSIREFLNFSLKSLMAVRVEPSGDPTGEERK
jgi:polyhydroxyalkanoate synthesis regulator protein